MASFARHNFLNQKLAELVQRKSHWRWISSSGQKRTILFQVSLKVVYNDAPAAERYGKIVCTKRKEERDGEGDEKNYGDDTCSK